jgi:predicted secreted protein
MEPAGMRGQSSELHKIRLKVGDEHHLRLKGLGSAGYDWKLALEGLPEIVKWDMLPVSIQEHPAIPGGLPPDSSNVDSELIITALHPGRTRIRLSLCRAWEKDRPPLNETILDIAVSR